MTFSVKADTSNGHFEVSAQLEDDEDSTPAQSNSFGNIDAVDKALIKQRFFELQTN
jgi:hypothetical protein